MKTIIFLALFSLAAIVDADELHFGLNVTHIWESEYKTDSGEYKKYNENNNLFIYFDEAGNGIGGMINSYGKPSPMILKKFEERANCGFASYIAKECFGALTFGAAFNYTDVNKTGVLPVISGGFKMKNKNFSVNTSIFNAIAIITTLGYQF